MTLNPIVAENQKPGTPQSTWAIHGSIDNQGDSQIEGFATQISVNAGQAVDFKINDSVTGGYTIDIYRLGCYGGDGACLVTSMHNSGGINQPNPTFNNSTNTVDAGNWTVTDSWAVPTDATSGVYFAKLTTDNGNYQNMISFIVRDDGTTSDIVFQTSDTTWQAYNDWGGYNLYGGPDGRAYAVSYNRPIAMNSTTNSAGPADFLFGSEYAAIYWLEENGYNVSYISGIDAATNGSLLLNAKIYIDVGHDEYWTQSQYANVQAAANAGVNLAFLSGNNTFWCCELAADINNVPNRTLVQYKDIQSGQQLDPNGPSNGGAGLFRDPTYGLGTPENALVGTIFTVNADNNKLWNITIPASMSQLRIWRNTSIAAGNGGTLTNLLGYEWNSDLDNGFRPTGLIDLSSTTYNVNSLMTDNGASYNGSGTATHSLTLYRDQTSGALIFSAGTMNWSWGLDDQHTQYGPSTPVSKAVQQSMVNLFADMGVQPQTLMATLQMAQQSTDHTLPVALITTPSSGLTVVNGQVITIAGTATDVGGRVAGVEVSTDGGLTWHPASGTTNWSYSGRVSGSGLIEARAIDDSVNLQSTPATVLLNIPQTNGFFSAANTPALTVNDGQQVEVGVKFTSSVAGSVTGIKFYRAAGDTGTDIVDLWSSTGTLLATGTFSSTSATGWQTVTFSSPVAITAGSTYVASYHTTGVYADTRNYFTTSLTSGPLTAPANAGVYAYGGNSTTGIFPTNTYQASNYFVDVTFNPVPVAPPQPPVANADSLAITQNGASIIMASTLLANDTDANVDPLTVTGVSDATNGTASFNAATNAVTFTPTAGYTGPASFNYSISDGHSGTASTAVNLTVVPNQVPVAVADSGFTTFKNAAITIAGSTLLANDTDGNGDPLIITGVTSLTNGNGTASFNAATNAVTFTPTAGYTGPASFNYSISDSHGGSAFNTVSLDVTASPPQTQSLFSAANTPALTVNDGQQVEVGVKFTSSVAGSVTGIKFYRAAGDTGTDIVDLWSSTGTLLATGTFSSTSATGWQTVTFSSPVAITAGSTYVASYHTTAVYADTRNYFTTSLTSGPLTAPANAGVYAYGGNSTTGIFPTNTYQASNYFVDVTFNPVPVAPPQPPVANADSLAITQNGASIIMASTLLANDTDANVDPLTVTGVSDATNGTASFNAATNAVTFTPTAGYTGPASFNYSISDGHSGTASTAVNLTVVPNQVPVAVADSGFTTFKNAAITIAGSTLLANDTDGNGDPLIITGVTSLTNGNGTASFNAATNAVTFTPTAGYTGPASFNYSISDSHGGSAFNTVSLDVTASPPQTQSLFSAANTPALTVNDGQQVEVGVKFTSSVAGSVTGIKFYRAAGDTGTDIVDLWSSTGTLLATGTFSSTSATGWQTVTFSSPVAITAGSTYVASYHTTAVYADTRNYFTTSLTSGPLTAPANAGVYAYGGNSTTGIFPTNTYQASNYFVDIAFNPQLTS